MLQLRLGVAAAVTGLCGHFAFVYRERTRAPSGRLLHFSPGSQDDIISDSLRTGDLLLFSRDCALYGCAGAAACSLRQAGGGAFDHAGVVVLLAGVPHVLEEGWGGASLRRFDARVRCSRARTLALRPLRGAPLTPAAAAAGEAWALRAVAPERGPGGAPAGSGPGAAMGAALLQGGGGALAAAREALRTAAGDTRANASLPLVARFYEALGVAPPGALAQMEDLSPPRQPLAAGARFGGTVWVRALA
jgi:hypothetical protein